MTTASDSWCRKELGHVMLHKPRDLADLTEFAASCRGRKEVEAPLGRRFGGDLLGVEDPRRPPRPPSTTTPDPAPGPAGALSIDDHAFWGPLPSRRGVFAWPSN